MAEFTLENVLQESLEEAFEVTFGSSAPFGIFSQTGTITNSVFKFTRDVMSSSTAKEHDPNVANVINKIRIAEITYSLGETEIFAVHVPREWTEYDYEKLRNVATREFKKQLSKMLVDIERNELWGQVKATVITPVPYSATSTNGRIVDPADLTDSNAAAISKLVTAVEVDFVSDTGKEIHLELETRRDQLATIVSDFVDITDNEEYVIFIDDLTNRKLTNELAFSNNTVSVPLIQMGFKNTVGELCGSPVFKNLRMGDITIAATSRKVFAIIASRESVSVKWIMGGQDLRDRPDSLDKNAITEYVAKGGVTQPEQILILHAPAPA